ncbi:MAG: hypothetical protein K2Y28_11240 [Burkholderiaceae bacterium]|nr:hypothetical protein [Burkholderiaceae bacterium]
MSSSKELIKLERSELRRKYGQLFDKVSSILFVADLQGISFETNIDEYEPEVGTILPRLTQAKSVDDVALIVCEEFSKWFYDGAAGTVSQYNEVAEQIWRAWNDFNLRQV